MSTKSVNNTEQPADKGLRDADCSSFRSWWEDTENGCPQLVLDNDEQFAVAVWNAAIERALLVIPGGSLCDPQEAADTIRELIEPNADVELPRERKDHE